VIVGFIANRYRIPPTKLACVRYCPIASRSRKYTPEDAKFIESEIQQLLAADIIEPARSPWRAQILVVHQGPKKRLVIDYSTPINRFTLLDAYPLPNIEELVNKVAQAKYHSSLNLRSAYHQIPLLEEERFYTDFEAGSELYQYKRLPFGVTNGVSTFQRTIDCFIKRYQLQKVYAYLDDLTVTGETIEVHDLTLKCLLDAAAGCNLTLNEEKSKIRMTSLRMLGYLVSYQNLKPDPERLQTLFDLPIPSSSKELKRVCCMFAYYARWIPNFSQKARPLLLTYHFPISPEAERAFAELKSDLGKASLGDIQVGVPFELGTDASDNAVAAVLSQGGRPVAFMSRTLNHYEKRYPAVEKEATAVIEAVCKWQHFLKGRCFTIVTDQEAISFMFDQRHHGKIKKTLK